MAEKLYRVRSGGAGNFAQGETITKAQAGEWFDKWIRTGGISELTAEEQKLYDEAAAKQTDEEKAAGIDVDRSSALATGDMDATPTPPDVVEKQQKAAGAGGK